MKFLRKEKRLNLFIALALVMLLAFGTTLTVLAAAAVTPEHLEVNQDPSYTGYSDYKFEGNNNDTQYFDDDFEPVNYETDNYITVTFSSDKKFVDWESSFDIYKVFVKGGDSGYLYDYDNDPLTSDEELRAPDNTGGQQPTISHVTFYWMVEEEPDDDTIEVIVTKVVIDEDENEITSDTTDFTVNIFDGSDFSDTDEISVGNPATFNLPIGSFVIEEEEEDDYEFVDMTGDVDYDEDDDVYSITIDADTEGPLYITITNMYLEDEDYVTLKIFKVITGDAGFSSSLGFPVTVTPTNDTPGEARSRNVSVDNPWEITDLVPGGTYQVTEGDMPNSRYTFVSITNDGVVSFDCPVQTLISLGDGCVDYIEITITNRYTRPTSSTTTTTTTTPVVPPVEIDIEPEIPLVDDEIEPEIPMVDEEPEEEPEEVEIEVIPELPKTSASDILVLALGAIAAGGGILFRRKRK